MSEAESGDLHKYNIIIIINIIVWKVCIQLGLELTHL